MCCTFKQLLTNILFESWWGIRSLVFWANPWFLLAKEGFTREKELLFCHEQQEWIAHDLSFVRAIEGRAMGAIHSWSQKGGKTVKNCEKLSKAYVKYVFSKGSARFLRAICLNHEQITGITLFLRNWEQFAHSRSFVMSDLSELLTFALLLGATRVICSLNNMSNFEWKSEFWTLVLIEEKAYL